MDNKRIEELISIMDKADLTALRIREGKTSIELERRGAFLPGGALPGVAERVEALLADKAQSHEDAAISLENNSQNDGIIVRSPMVGMFYVAPSPDEEPFVRVGQEVLNGQTLAIVEAMKMMNEITATASGVITEVLAANDSQVEYDQPLFRITTNSAAL